MKLATIALFLLLAGPEGRRADARSGWTVVVDGAVRLEQRPEAGHQLPRLRATTVVDAPISVVGKMIHDADRHHEWMHNTEASELLAKRKRGFVVYHRLDSPPPVKDRDVILQIRVGHEDGHCHFEFKNVSWPDKPPQTGVVRMAHLSGAFDLRSRSDGKTRVVYEFLADPAGTLPAFMAKKGMRDIPLVTLQNLRKRAAAAGSP